jgi:hypothetical protein
MNKQYLLALPVLLTGKLLAAPTPEQIEFFESRIRPVLAQDCYECHSASTKQKGGLVLDSRAGWQAGGDTGAAIKPGDPEASLLLQSIRHDHSDLKMPKNGAKLDERVVADFERWIKEGAPDPRDHPPSKAEVAKDTAWGSVLERRKQWWCFQPVKASPVPAGPAGTHPVDAFIDAKLKETGLQPVTATHPRSLIRRLNYVITGLPPSPEEISAFEQAASLDLSAATEALVDRLLQSPRYGEAWARHWLDWVRYAESYGSEGDPEIPYAWRYRDYVIRAFNDSVPYPQMVREAIAGDLLAKPRINKTTGLNESAIGIGQLRMVLHGFSPTDSLDEQVTFTDNQIDTVTKTFQALTVSCARCHNHKFDAISQADFYSLYGIFTSTRPAVIDVNAPGAGKTEREELSKLKQDIKQVVGQAWAKAAAELKPVTAKATQSAPVEVLKRLDLQTNKWFTDGQGVKQGATKAGEFSIALDDKKVIAHIHPGGVFSGLISTKDRGVLMSERFKCDGGTLWMRSAGAGGSRAKYVVQNYPRTGTIHKAKEFKDAGDSALGWRQLDLNYWKGDDIFIQLATAADMPAETKLDEPSWFGVTDVVITKGKEPPPSPAIGGDPRAAVAAWQAGAMTDAQAELLEALLQANKLPNQIQDIAGVAPLLKRYRALEAKLPQPTRVPGVLEADGHDAPLYLQGDHKQPAEIVQRRFLDGIDPTPYKAANSGRLQLAESLVDPANPLTARVMVNRIWNHVFGRGLVATPDNFGRLGDPPSHPELLDYLATHFTQSGGSIKGMIRLLVTSQTFQRDNRIPAGAAEKDPDNKLLSHWTVRRLEAEAIRDSILGLSGKLSTDMYGEPVFSKDARRSVYVRVVRNSLDPFLTAFDMPVPFSTRGKRDVTNVPAQSLALLNDSAITTWTSNWARQKAQPKNPVQRVNQMFVQALGRKATTDEIAASIAFIESSAEAAQEQGKELQSLTDKAYALQKRINGVLDPLRTKLTEQRPTKSVTNAPEPYAEWDFEKDGNDIKGHLPLKLEGAAKIENGALILDGTSALARSEPLPKNLTSKTLEAWVLLDSLGQAGGGVMTVQDLRGVIFDSIVFGEKDPGQWLAGSNNFTRTRSFSGPIEAEAANRPVHIAITYAGGKVQAFRDGQQYGSGYKVDEEARFTAGASQILLGCRHGSAGGNRSLKGRILRARLYDRALTVPEIEGSRHVEATVITERDLLDALSDAQRTEVRLWQTDAEKLNTQIQALASRVERLSPETAGWESLALSIVNLKEFIYLR